jgi:hypothetical protein
LAVANYYDNNGSLPPAYIADESGKPMHSWRVLLLPYMEQSELYEAYDFSEPWDGPNNRKLFQRRPRAYAFPNAEKGGSVTNYLAVIGPQTAWPGAEPAVHKEIYANSGSTILVVENHGSGIHWTEPRDLQFDTMNMSLRDEAPDGVSSPYKLVGVVTINGGLNTLDPDLSPDELRAMLTLNSQQPINSAAVQQMEDGRKRPLKKP